MRAPGLSEYVAQVLDDTQVPAANLKFELTEGGLISNVSTARAVLDAFHDMGIELMLDDFGTGYSSLSYLADLPVSVVKIDKSFVDRVTHDAEGAAMVRGVIDLSHALGLTCIAEGVEHENQLAVLDDLGCDNTQGYFFARPTSSADVAAILSRLRAGQTASAVPATLSS
jgi:EAL domain-containing protein (putative c-di-GMP-specific phosphodiesterase class I)